jgi:hypothetical protein
VGGESFVRKLPAITVSIATMEKDPVWPQHKLGAATLQNPTSPEQLSNSVKTLQEPKTGPLEPFEIAVVCPYLSLFQQLANESFKGNADPPPERLRL